MLKTILATSMAVAVLGMAPLMALADDMPMTQPGLRLNSAPMTAPSSNFSQPAMMPSATPDDSAALRGHIGTIPKGTMMMVKLNQTVNSQSSRVGDPISASVESDVFLDNQIVVPSGSVVEGSVVGVSPAGHVGKPGSIDVQFYNIKTTYGNSLPIRGHIVTADASGVIRGDSEQAQVLKTGGVVVGSAAAGTLMGLSAGSLIGSAGAGTLFGLAAGGLAGVGYALYREGKEVVIPTNARMSIVLDQTANAN